MGGAALLALASACATTPPTAGRETPVQSHPAADAAVAPQLSDPRLRIQLVASEPMVQSPVAITFDEHGRMFVVEMTDYPHDRDTHPGRISLLEDTDGDGIFDRSTIYADNLAWPSGAASYDGGLFVAASPDLLYLKDTDGDGRADQRRVVYTGFGNTVPEMMPDMVVNGFAWGLDNRLYGATSRNGGVVSAPSSADTFDLRGRDFSIDPRTLQLRPEAGGGQFGQTFDDYGRRLVSSNANHLMMAMYELRYTDNNPHVEYPRPIIDIPADGPSAEVFRISPEEEWRVLRTQWRAAGKVRGGLEHGGRTSGYFTSACSVVVYRGDALPPDYYGNAFVAEPANNLAHRKALVSDGIPLKGVRPERDAGTEFLRSPSLWFRPVNFANGPDGALYVVDMHRAIVEDPKTIPADIVSALDVRAGSTMGRIYRITAANARSRPSSGLGRADGPALAAALADANGWVRETAARLIYERQDMSSVPMLEGLAISSPTGTGRLRALYALQGLGRLTPTHLLAALGDADAGVREHAIRLAEGFADDLSLRRAVLALASDAAPRVRYQLAFTLGTLPSGDDIESALLTLLGRDVDDPWLRTAAVTALGPGQRVLSIVQRLSTTSGFVASSGGQRFLGQALTTVAAAGDVTVLTSVTDVLSGVDDEGVRLALTRDFFAGLARGHVDIANADPRGRLAATLTRAAHLTADATADPQLRVTALEVLAQDPRVDAQPFLRVLRPTEPDAVQRAAMTAIRMRDDADTAAALVARWGMLTPRVRQEALGVLLARPERARVLLDGVRAGTVLVSDLTAGQAQTLIAHPDPEVARKAASLLPVATASRQDVVDRFVPALQLRAEASRGRAVFTNVCASCHRLDDTGFELGPNLLGVRNHGREGLLIDIFDPNRKVDPSYLFYEITTRDGTTLLGAVVNETATSLTVAEAYGTRTVVPRAEIVRMQSVGRSMMPDGLESAMTSQDVADLLEYLVGADR